MVKIANSKKVKGMRGEIGKNFLSTVFTGYSFMHCLKELLKNSRDWGATIINITTSNPVYLDIVDDGVGLNEARRISMVSVSKTTANETQMGKFGTGSKHVLFSIATVVRVRTAPQEEPNLVYVFEMDTETYERKIMSGEEIIPEVYDKTKETWSHSHPFGTQLTYTLADAKGRHFYRGQKLADELSSMLPIKYSRIVKVDGEYIPQRKVKGEIYTYSIKNEELGTLSIELYNPQKRRQGDEVIFAPSELGEVALQNFLKAAGDKAQRFPLLYSLPEVCGTISCSFFRKYANENRTTMNSALATEPRVDRLFKLLEKIGPDVKKALEIQLESLADTDDKSYIDQVAAHFNRIYDPEEGPITGYGPGGGLPPGTHKKRSTPLPLRLQCQDEYANGEDLEITLVIEDPALQDLPLSAFRWNTTMSRVSNGKVIDNTFKGTVTTVGPGEVIVEIPGRPEQAKASYTVKETRELRISPEHANIKVGSSMILFARNMDVVRGEIVWKIKEGIGNLEGSGGSASFKPEEQGIVKIIMYDSAFPKHVCEATLNILDNRTDIVCINGEQFQYQAVVSIFDTPVTFHKIGKHPKILINIENQLYKDAKEKGVLSKFLKQLFVNSYSLYASERILLDDTSLTTKAASMERLCKETEKLSAKLFLDSI